MKILAYLTFNRFVKYLNKVYNIILNIIKGEISMLIRILK